MTLLEQLRSDLPENSHRQRVFFPGGDDEVQELVKRARELQLRTIRYLMTLDRFEQRPREGDPKRAAFDVLIAALTEVTPRLAALPAIERPTSEL